jgi:thiol-disulfide isomerase/thioredoxin
MRFSLRLVGVAGWAWWLAGLGVSVASGQQGPNLGFSRLIEIEARYRKSAEDLDRSKLLSLSFLAKDAKGEESEAAYRAAFNLAVARNLYADAEAAARGYLSREAAGDPQSQALAASIVLVNRATRGEYDQSLADLENFLKRRAAEKIPEEKRLPAGLIFAVGEAYLQRLIQGGRYDIASKVCQVAAANHPDPGVKAYFQRRQDRLELIGKPAPSIEGTDVDGKTVRLADFQGKVVLVDFWATWCPPCVAEFPLLHQLAVEHKDKGLVVLGVNLDQLARNETANKATSSDSAPGDVRWFLISQHAGWPNLVGPGAEAAARSYGVEEIPARFLIGRDGRIQQLEQRDQALARSVEQALATPAEKP